MLGKGGGNILSTLCCAKITFFGHLKRDIERKLESRGCFSRANVFALLNLRNRTDIVAYRNTCGANLLLSCFKYVYIILEKYEKMPQFFSILNFLSS